MMLANHFIELGAWITLLGGCWLPGLKGLSLMHMCGHI
jgi:hypothetical protein